MNTEKIIIITAPSGSGKTTLVKRLLASCCNLAFSVSACTRKPRLEEQDKKDYYFIDEDCFKNLINNDAFVEWEMVYPGKYYGTLKSELQRIWDENKTPVIDIDIKGALAIKDKYPDITLSIFIEVPSLEELSRRLKSRGTETDESIAERVAKAEYEISFANKFDTIIVNYDIDIAQEELIKLVENFIIL